MDVLSQCFELVLSWMGAYKLKLNPDKIEMRYSVIQVVDSQPVLKGLALFLKE